MLDRVWELRHHLSAHDAAYVALAEGLRCRLVTGDASDQSSAWAALPGDSVARLTESWPQMLTELRAVQANFSALREIPHKSC